MMTIKSTTERRRYSLVMMTIKPTTEYRGCPITVDESRQAVGWSRLNTAREITVSASVGPGFVRASCRYGMTLGPDLQTAVKDCQALIDGALR